MDGPKIIKLVVKKIENVKIDDLKLSMHKCHKFTLTPTSMTVCFISKDMSNRLFFSFRDRIISFFQNVHIQSFEPSKTSFLDRLLSVVWIGYFHLFVLSSFVFVPSIVVCKVLVERSGAQMVKTKCT